MATRLLSSSNRLSHIIDAIIASQATLSARDTPYMQSFRGQMPSVPQLQKSDRVQTEWQSKTDPPPYKMACGSSVEEVAKRAITVPPLIDPLLDFGFSEETGDQLRWNKCHLLSLPQELRVQIWSYVLTDSTQPDFVVRILREPVSVCYKYELPPAPRSRVSHETPRTAPINLNLLLTNRFIYDEALPILYRPAVFTPDDLKGLLPLFLNTLSAKALSCIRRVRLVIPSPIISEMPCSDHSKPYFHWAITCAQVAKMNQTLRQVEVVGDFAMFEVAIYRRAFLHPLCKIKAPKKFVPNDRQKGEQCILDAQFQKCLAHAANDLKEAAKLREERAKIDALQRAKQIEHRNDSDCAKLEGEEATASFCQIPRQDYLGVLKSSKRKSWMTSNCLDAGSIPIASDNMEEWCRWAEENLKRMESDLSLVQGIKQFEKELEEHAQQLGADCPEVDVDTGIVTEADMPILDWDIVSLRSGASTPKLRPISVLSKRSVGDWADTASTLVDRDDVSNGDVSDVGSEEWEHIDK